MFNLIRNEWMKILNRPGPYIMVGLIIFVIAFTIKLDFNFYEQQEETWQESLVIDNEYIQESLKTEENNFFIQSYEKELAINEYRLANDLPPISGSVWGVLQEQSYMIPLVGMFAIIIASGIVASEFSGGTIKLLMIRPFPRWKILLSKFITVATFGLSMIGIVVTISLILGFIFFDTGSITHLVYENGSVVEGSMFIYLAKVYLFKSIDIILLVTMAFMISAAFRNSSLAIGTSLFLYFVGGTATSFLAANFDWAKYSLFANTNLSRYEMGGMPFVEGMTMTFSVIMILIYFSLFVTLAFTVFTKRDIAS